MNLIKIRENFKRIDENENLLNCRVFCIKNMNKINQNNENNKNE